MHLNGQHSSQASGPTPARIFVVEDHPLVRQGVVGMINRTPGLECCGEAETVAGTGMRIAQLCPDVVLLDLRLQDGEAFGLLACLRHHLPPPIVLVLTNSSRPDHVDRAMQAGARGFLLKEDAPEKLVDAIHAVLQGQFYMSRSLTSHLLRRSAA